MSELVTIRKITPDLWDQLKAKGGDAALDALRREEQMGIKYVQKEHPGSVFRVGCNCCYGDGPDIEIWTKYPEEGGVVIELSVNFKFNVDDYEGH